MSNLIQLSNINKSFLSLKRINVLKKVSYKFKSGKIYSLMGPSGSGKSTLLNLLSLIDRPSSGSIIIDNKKIDHNNSQRNDLLRANKIGIIYQQDNLLSDFTAIENLTLASLASGKNKGDASNISMIMLKKVGLAKRLNHYPSQLSGGEKQRVSIARALINNPQIILADEPTGSLDIETAKGIFELLKNQIKPDRIIIFATHNRFFANKSDCLLEIVDGNIKTING
ncbi:ABC transporter ATP-binding protein [Candidatus Pelagibacter sp.]|uniref:ABC transporter ATP-binding protein n=1 Tax=Candidatus Pelagibacter sp. TaxID=2024849 RepID=UPI003F864A57